MAMQTQRPGYHSVTPYLTVDGAAGAIDWYVRALGAVELYRLVDRGRIGNAEIMLGDARVSVSDAYPEAGVLGPDAHGGSSVRLKVYVDDVDTAYARAIAAGAVATRPPADQFFGDRTATFTDPFGHRWMLATHIEPVSPEEMQRRLTAMTAG